MRVKCKTRTYVNGSTHDPGDEIEIADHLYSPEVHEKISGAPARSAGGSVPTADDWQKQTSAEDLRARAGKPRV